MAIETVLLVFIIMMMVGMSYGAYYFVCKYPDLLKRRVYSGKVARNRQLDKIEKDLDQEITSLLINESPEILEMFPKSTERAIESNNVPGWVGMAMGKAIPFLAKFLGTSQHVANNPALAQVTNAAQIPGVAEALLGVFNRFANRDKGDKDKKPKDKKPKAGTFPDFV